MTITSEMVIFFDVDDTLVMWAKPESTATATVQITNPYSGDINTLIPHVGHIKVLKDRKARGAHIIVWSASGYRWAAAVVKALGLTEYVDTIMSKPILYVDDCEATNFMGPRLYLEPKSGYGK